jgi:hypothetical protein
MSTIESMTRRPRQIPPASTAAARLLLNPALKDDAQSLVSIFDRIDWDQVRQTQCDTVQFIFQSNKDVQVPHRIFLEMTAIDDELRKNLISEIKGSFQRKGFPLDPGTLDDKTFHRRSVEKILTDINAAKIPSRFAELCIQSDLLHRKISREVWREQQRNIRTGRQGTPPMPPLTAASNTSWLGPIDDNWITVPIRLALAEPIVGLCRRISEVNTGETVLHLKPIEKNSLLQQHRLFMECEPLTYRAVVGDDNPPVWYKLQGILDDFFPALRNLIFAWLGQGNAIGFEAVAKDSATFAIAESQPMRNQRTPQGPQEIPPVHGKVNAAKHTESSGARSTQKTELKLVNINVNKDMIVKVNGTPIRPTAPANALRALAALCDDGSSGLNIDTAEFVLLTHRVEKDVAKRWNGNKRCLEKNGIKVELVNNGCWHISGFKISLDPSITSQDVRIHLESRRARVRPKNPATS